MRRKKIGIKVLGAAVILVVVANFLFLIFNKITPILFWLIMAVSALFAYKILPNLANRLKN